MTLLVLFYLGFVSTILVLIALLLSFTILFLLFIILFFLSPKFRFYIEANKNFIFFKKIYCFNLYVNEKIRIRFTEELLLLISGLLFFFYFYLWISNSEVENNISYLYYYTGAMFYTFVQSSFLKKKKQFGIEQLDKIEHQTEESKKILKTWLWYITITHNVFKYSIFLFLFLIINNIADGTEAGFPIKQTFRYILGDIENTEYVKSMQNPYEYYHDTLDLKKDISNYKSGLTLEEIASLKLGEKHQGVLDLENAFMRKWKR